MRNFESRYSYITFSFLAKILIDASYVGFVSDIYDYSGFSLNPSVTKYIESWLLYIAIVLALPYKFRRPSDFYVNLTGFIFIAPLLSYYGLSGQNRLHLYSVLLGFLVILAFRRGRQLRLPYFKGSLVWIAALTLVGALVVSGWMVASGGLVFFNLNLMNVYEYRRDAGETIGVGLFSYMNIWAPKVFGPCILVFGLLYRNRWLVFLALTLHIFWFGILNLKSVLFYPLIIIFVWFFLRTSRGLVIIPFMLVLGLLTAYVVFLAADVIIVASLFIRRILFVPSYLTFEYYEYFSDAAHVYWTNSFMSWYADYPYSDSPAELIGAWTGTTGHANNSFFATGYMHAGVLGVVLYSLIVGLLLRVVDWFTYKRLPLWVGTSIVLVPLFALIRSADLPTTLLSHGLALSMLALFFMRSKRDWRASV